MSEERTVENLSRPGETVLQLSVTVARGKDAGKALEAPIGEPAQIGVSPDNDLVLTDPKVSHYHLELTPSDAGIVVRDLGSTNGTFVGQTRVVHAVVAKGAQLRAGDTVLIVDAARAERGVEAVPVLPGLVFVSARMRELARQTAKLAGFGGAVLVQGETGTGKELVARALHEIGPRATGPLVIVDSGALPGTLVTSELFGHERGAFTGADRRMIGAFERANGGTIFLDEVGELPLAVQPALLGVLQRKTIRRLGGDKEIPVDVRVVSATHRDLREEVNRGTFREDLYFRLAGARIVVPPLRDRKEDLAALVAHFACEITGSADVPDFLVRAMDSFQAQMWPGNVRELRSAVERALWEGSVETGTAEIAPSAPPDLTSDAHIDRYRDARARAIATFEESYLRDLIQRCGDNASEAARRAGMDRPYLLTLLRRYGLRGARSK